MPDRYGIVTGIDRTNRVVGARLDDGLSVWLDGRGAGFPYRGLPPPPLSICYFSDLGGGQFVCEAPLGDSRVVVHEDWTIFTAPSGTLYTGDTPWTIRENNAGGSSVAIANVDMQGAVRLLQQTTAGNYRSFAKDIGILPPTPAAVVWYSERMRLGAVAGELLTTRDDVHGLGDAAQWTGFAAGNDVAAWRFVPSVSANWQLYVGAGGVATLTVSATAGTTGIVTFDIVYAPGLWVAGWVDGDGPYVVTANVPDQATALAPGFMLFLDAGAAGDRYVTVDWQHLEYLSEAVDPLLLDDRERVRSWRGPS